MHNSAAKFAKILDICKRFPENLVNRRGNYGRKRLCYSTHFRSFCKNEETYRMSAFYYTGLRLPSSLNIKVEVFYRLHPMRNRSPYFALFRLLHSLHSIWQFSATVRPPSTHGVIWSASISSISKCFPHSGQIPP